MAADVASMTVKAVVERLWVAKQRTTARWALAGILLLAAALRFYALGRESLWFDEAFSVSVAQWYPLWLIIKPEDTGLFWTDRNLFHLMLHYTLLLGQTEAMVRSISAISGVLTVVAIYALGKRLFGQKVALLAALLLAVSPMHVWYSREGRSYALLTLFSILAVYFVVRALARNDRASWAASAILAGCAVHTHSFGVLVAGAANLYVLIWLAGRGWPGAVLRRWIGSLVLLALTFVPIIVSVLSRATGVWHDWIADKYGAPRLVDLALTMGAFSFNTAYDRQRVLYALALAVFAVPCIVALRDLLVSLRSREQWRQTGEPLMLVLVYLVAPIAVLFVASQVLPLYMVRYLLPFLPPYVLLLSYGILALPKPAAGGTGLRRVDWRLIALAAVLIISVPSLADDYRTGQKENWRDGAAFVAAGAQARDLVVVYDAYMSIAFNFYYKGPGEQLIISRWAPDDEMEGHVARMSSGAYPRLWLVLSHADEKRLTDLLESRPNVTRVEEKRLLGLAVVSYAVGPPP